VLNQSALVLEGVTLAQVVKLVVKVLVNLAAGTVLDEEAAENAESAHPNDLAVVVVSAHSIVSRPLKRIIGVVLHTLAYEHLRYPYAYRNPCVYRVSSHRCGLSRVPSSAW
jgi:hypothetical protein